MDKKQLVARGLTVGALGVVFGDIGTSPLYALLTLFGKNGRNMAINPTNVYGVISLIIWAVIIVVCIKYVGTVMRVNNANEGGIMALVSLVKKSRLAEKYKWGFIVIGLVGVSLFYGDSAITPAISVLSAVEGLKEITPTLASFVLPVTIAILVLLFSIQRFGTSVIGRMFGPVMALWFVVIGLAGLGNLLAHPSALVALSPTSAVHFISLHPMLAFLSLTAVVLAITGAEALYADMGHFGRPPISRAWFSLVLPALALCYIGQGAVLLHNPSALASPFYHLFPSFLFIPVVILATLATLIASQSVISGAFSLTRQAIHLGFLPSMLVRHTSDEESGQIFMPLVNVALLVLVLVLVVAFGSSAALAGAYGVAISGAILIDSVLFIAVILAAGKMSKWLAALAIFIFLPVEILFAASNLTKFISGGWFPLAVALVVFVVATTWIKGEKVIAAERQRLEGNLIDYVEEIHDRAARINRLPGQAVYVGHHPGYAPLALHMSVDKLRELHQRVVIVTVSVANEAHVAPENRAKFNPLKYKGDNISSLELTYGYHDTPNVPRTIESLSSTEPELKINPEKVQYFVSLTKVVSTRRRDLAAWRKPLYLFMARNRRSLSDHLHLPPERTIDIEAEIGL